MVIYAFLKECVRKSTAGVELVSEGVWSTAEWAMKGLFSLTLVGEILFFTQHPRYSLAKPHATDTTRESSKAVAEGTWQHYQSVSSKRNLFQEPVQHVVRVVKPLMLPPPPVIPPVHVPTLAEMASDLQLTGIVNTGEPQALIKNTKTDETLYLSAGQRIGEIVVTSVTDSHVTLSFNGQTMELSL